MKITINNGAMIIDNFDKKYNDLINQFEEIFREYSENVSKDNENRNEIVEFVKNEMSVIRNMNSYLREICKCQKFPVPSAELKEKKGIQMSDNSMPIWGALEKYSEFTSEFWQNLNND